LFEKLYGKFSIDLAQRDRPDAAITVYKPHKRFGGNRRPFRVGGEITTVDKAALLTNCAMACDWLESASWMVSFTP
jgi:hypothetical protein